MPDEDRREQPERIYLEPGWHDNAENLRDAARRLEGGEGGEDWIEEQAAEEET